MSSRKPVWVAIVVAFITLFVIAPLAGAADIAPPNPPPPSYPPTTGNG